MHRLLRLGLTVVAIAGLTACGDSTATDLPTPAITTDSASYTAIPIGYDQVVVRIVLTLRNSTAVPIALDRCAANSPYPIYGVELLGSSNRDGAAYNPAWACVGGVSPIVVAPGEMRADTLTLRGPTQYDEIHAQYLGALEGSFRVSYGSQTSNAFTIKLPLGGAVPGVVRDQSASIQTDSLLVHLKFSTAVYRTTTPIHITMHNPRPDTSFIVNCDGSTSLSLERQSGDQWSAVWTAVVPGCLSGAIVIPPNGNYATSLDIIGGAQGTNSAPRFEVKDIPGVYRLVWSSIVDSFSFQSSSWGAPIPVEYRRSNPFAIVVDQ